MITHYFAASLLSKNGVLSHPASVDGTPSPTNKEDHVITGSISIRKCLEIKNNLSRVLSIEIMCTYQFIYLKDKGRLGIGTSSIYKMVRKISDVVE